MAITHIATGTLHNSTADLTVTIPAGYSDGDLIVIAAMARTGSETLVTPSGYEVLYKSTTSSMWFLGKYASGTESSASLDFSGSSRHVAQAAIFRGVKPTLLSGAIDGTAQSTDGGASALSYPAITPTENGCLVLMLGRWAQTSISALSSDPISGFTELGDLHANQGGSLSLLFLWNYQIQSTAATVSASTWPILGTPEADTQQSIALALKAASGSVAPIVAYYQSMQD